MAAVSNVWYYTHTHIQTYAPFIQQFNVDEQTHPFHINPDGQTGKDKE